MGEHRIKRYLINFQSQNIKQATMKSARDKIFKSEKELLEIKI